jgi:hypothetical protein
MIQLDYVGPLKDEQRASLAKLLQATGLSVAAFEVVDPELEESWPFFVAVKSDDVVGYLQGALEQRYYDLLGGPQAPPRSREWRYLAQKHVAPGWATAAGRDRGAWIERIQISNELQDAGCGWQLFRSFASAAQQAGFDYLALQIQEKPDGKTTQQGRIQAFTRWGLRPLRQDPKACVYGAAIADILAGTASH